MKVVFSSLDDQMNRINFTSEVQQLGNQYLFEDKSLQNTTIQLRVEDDCVHLKRSGQTVMDILFDPTEETLGSYQNEMGLAFEFVIHCTKLSITPKRIMIRYEMKQDMLLSKHQISFVFH